MKCCECSPGTAFAIRASLAVLGVAAGLLAGIVFTVVFSHTHASAWAFASALSATLALSLFIYIYVRKERQARELSRAVLLSYAVVGALGLGLGVGAFVAYLGLGIYQATCGDDDTVDVVRSDFVVCVWCFMIVKWSLTCYYYGMKELCCRKTSSHYSHLQESTE